MAEASTSKLSVAAVPSPAEPQQTMNTNECLLPAEIVYLLYSGEHEIPAIMRLCEDELSEPYSVFTYRYFLKDWPHLCFFARDGDRPVGVIVCKQDVHKSGKNRGYIAMLSILPSHRKRGIASKLVHLALDAMIRNRAEEIVLETEVDNNSALCLYEKLGFLREKRLFAFYLNRKSAFRLVLPLAPPPSETEPPDLAQLSIAVDPGPLRVPTEMLDSMYS